MIPMLNAIGVHCAVYGNHDFGNIILHIYLVHELNGGTAAVVMFLSVFSSPARLYSICGHFNP